MDIQTLSGRGFECNSYLIRDEKTILVDVGTDHNVDHLLKTIYREHGQITITNIILTHTHLDHAGGARRLSEITGAEIFVHPTEGTRISSGDFSVTLTRLFEYSFEPFDWKGIEEGSLIDTGTGKFKVLHLPGHSEGSIGLWDEKSCSLITGDTVFADGGIGRYDLPSSDFEKLKNSIKRISALEVKNLYPGHGRAVLGTGSQHISESLSYIWSGA